MQDALPCHEYIYLDWQRRDATSRSHLTATIQAIIVAVPHVKNAR
jgi:predicted secreted protein